MKTFMTRVIGFGAFSALALGLISGAGAQSLSADQAATVRFRAISVDVSNYAAKGVGGIVSPGGAGFAHTVQQNVLAHARQMFADRMTSDKRAPTLVIKVDSVMMTQDSGRLGRRHGSFAASENGRDFMEGDGVIVSGGRVLATSHILAAKDSMSDMISDRQRLDELSDFYVSWVKKQMGL